MTELKRDADLQDVLAQAKTIAVLGAHKDTSKAAHYVPAYLVNSGYKVLPVNVRYVGETLFGQPVRATLTDLDEPVDIVDIFRRSDAVPEHLDEILGMKPLPRVVWMQEGVRNDEAAARLMEAGIAVVQEHCTMAEHRRLL